MIHVNSHEPPEIITILSSKTEVKVSDFTPGDYIVFNAGIERKSYGDFLTSIKTGRLLEQVKRLKKCYIHSYLLIEMPFLPSVVNIAPIYKIILRLFELGIKVLFSISPKHSAEIILLINDFRKKRINPSLISLPLRYKPKSMSLRDSQIFFMQGIPGVGYNGSIKILKHFRSINNFMTAGSKELKECRIIGKKRAKRIQRLIHATFK